MFDTIQWVDPKREKTRQSSTENNAYTVWVSSLPRNRTGHSWQETSFSIRLLEWRIELNLHLLGLQAQWGPNFSSVYVRVRLWKSEFTIANMRTEPANSFQDVVDRQYTSECHVLIWWINAMSSKKNELTGRLFFISLWYLIFQGVWIQTKLLPPTR